jgi:hypothetical protein
LRLDRAEPEVVAVAAHLLVVSEAMKVLSSIAEPPGKARLELETVAFFAP